MIMQNVLDIIVSFFSIGLRIIHDFFVEQRFWGVVRHPLNYTGPYLLAMEIYHQIKIGTTLYNAFHSKLLTKNLLTVKN